MSKKMFLMALVALTAPCFTLGYIPMTDKEHFVSEILLRDFVDHIDKDILDGNDDVYIDQLPNLPAQLGVMVRTSKDLDGEQIDYDALLDGNPSPSLRDQEYMQHSSLWGNQFMSGGAGESPHRFKPQIKTDASLPAYCNPPNPCPYGYTEDQGCIIDFENTAAFSRDYQTSQECMCDAEHMFDCPGTDQNDDNRHMASDLESFLARQFHNGEHKNMVAKKFHPSPDVFSEDQENPYLQGEKLPIAAKKGNHVF